MSVVLMPITKLKIPPIISAIQHISCIVIETFLINTTITIRSAMLGILSMIGFLAGYSVKLLNFDILHRDV